MARARLSPCPVPVSTWLSSRANRSFQVELRLAQACGRLPQNLLAFGQQLGRTRPLPHIHPRRGRQQRFPSQKSLHRACNRAVRRLRALAIAARMSHPYRKLFDHIA
jgi:hypothetical protein